MRVSSLLLYISFTSAAAIIPHNLLNSSQNAGNVTLNNSIVAPDPNFEVDVSYLGAKVPMISYLMSTVQYLTNLSVLEFSGYTTAISWTSTTNPQIRIVVLGERGATFIERRFIVWGLGMAAARMIDVKKFETASINLLWCGDYVGTIMILPRITKQLENQSHCPDLTQVSSQPSMLQNVHGSANESACSITGGGGGSDPKHNVTVTGRLTGPPVDLFDVFLFVTRALMDIAETESTAQLDQYHSPIAANIAVSFFAPVDRHPGPPFFEVRWLLEAIGKIPEIMIKNGAFQEAMFSIEVDSVRVADGYLEGTKLPAIWSSSVNSNISVS
ncbi:hypothetical protein ACLMJK_004610 [Lecanora helva]